MDTFFSLGARRTYNDFNKQISPEIKEQFELLRDYCLSLGTNVIEDIRMHRIVFCKSITFRWFLDMGPQEKTILLKIQLDRKEPQQIIDVKSNTNLEPIKEIIKDAFNSIH